MQGVTKLMARTVRADWTRQHKQLPPFNVGWKSKRREWVFLEWMKHRFSQNTTFSSNIPMPIRAKCSLCMSMEMVGGASHAVMRTTHWSGAFADALRSGCIKDCLETITSSPVRIFTNPTLIHQRQEIGQYHWLAFPESQ
ncbi:hypothetical protein AVEN_11210-1 [Araneus ventricosus]|uniref:Uncharacterized protein n=1 Tax=Araneus ventricosus TaxID=182803 RepID=A0A4Y2ITY9_ARAVE|nr:hypothetical protein AVEN_11210-1 [Araneus ventricosus]